MLALICAFGGPLVNKIGVKWSLIIGAATFPINGASYYVNSAYGNQWVSLWELMDRPRINVSNVSNSGIVLVSDLRKLARWHWYGILVCRRGWFHLVAGTCWGPREVPGSLDCVP